MGNCCRQPYNSERATENGAFTPIGKKYFNLNKIDAIRNNQKLLFKIIKVQARLRGMMVRKSLKNLPLQRSTQFGSVNKEPDTSFRTIQTTLIVKNKN